MELWDEDRCKPWRLGPPFDEGGEATVHYVEGDDTAVAKVFKEEGDRARYERCREWISEPPLDVPGHDGYVKFAAPKGILLDRRGGVFRAYLMQRVRDSVKMELVRNPGSSYFQSRETLVILAYRFALIAAELVGHSLKPIFADMNPSNVLYSCSGLPTLIDIDSLQITNSKGRILRSSVGMREYLPPELQGVDLSTIDRTVRHHNFAISEMIYGMLMNGVHSHASINSPKLTPWEWISDGDFAHKPGAKYAPSRLVPPFESLSPEIRELFLRAFYLGFTEPSARPSPAEWAVALRREIDNPYQAKIPAKPLSVSVPAHVSTPRISPMTLPKFRMPPIPWVRVGTYVAVLAIGLTAQALLSGNLGATVSRWLGTVSRPVDGGAAAREVPVIVQGPPFIKRLRQEMQDEANGSRTRAESGSSTPEGGEGRGAFSPGRSR